MQNTPPTPVEAICLENLCKSFGSVQANHNVCLTVYRGEILALLGENGSGKTTLVNMLSGIYRPDSGRISVNGRPVSIRSPKAVSYTHLFIICWDTGRLGSPGKMRE